MNQITRYDRSAMPTLFLLEMAKSAIEAKPLCIVFF